MKNPYDNIVIVAPKGNARNNSINIDLKNKVNESQRKRADSHVSIKSLNNM